MAVLTYGKRKALPIASFVFKKTRKYPINDAAHARNALARGAQYATPEELSTIKAAVKKKFPGIAVDGKERTQISENFNYKSKNPYTKREV